MNNVDQVVSSGAENAADVGDDGEPVDGRVARRQRNIDLVIDSVLEMFAEEAMFPTIEQAASRSGLSLRSLYRYFADPGELLEASIRRSRERGIEYGRLHNIGVGPFDERLNDFVDMRLRIYNAFGPVYRATTANAARHPRIRDERARTRNDMSKQFELQFAPELTKLKPAERAAATSAGDVLTNMDSLDYLRQHRQLTVAETKATLKAGLEALLR